MIEDFKKELTVEDLDRSIKNMGDLIENLFNTLEQQRAYIEEIEESVEALLKVINVDTHV